MSTETLSQDVGWEPSGHLSDVALSAVADGEDGLLDAEMNGHLGSCDACATRLGHVALRAADMAEVFTHIAARAEAKTDLAIAPAPVSPRPRRKAPVFAAAAVLAVALAAVVPSMLRMPYEAMHAWSVARKVAPSILRLVVQLIARTWSGPAGRLSVLVWCMAVALVVAGFSIARRASKKALVDGGTQ
jgi:hypothetical protein